MIDGMGVDLVRIDRIKDILNKWDTKFTDKLFTSNEIEYCTKHKDNHLHFASTFAAKEAFIKAHGRGNIRFKDIEILRENTGKPVIRLHGKAREMIVDKHINTINLTMTHDGEYCIAVVVLEK
ncbi:MAG: holo-[acyl-carrier-protein] synthase [Candidatus Dadabacteria bacterium]|nr:holo-[acyl-carrier-protein] synthase [Candidatus Dadabacteria bacterium]